MKYFKSVLILIASLPWYFAARASAVKSCDTVVEVLNTVTCQSGISECEIDFKSKCAFNNRGHDMGKCKFEGEVFKASVVLPAGDFSFKKGDNIKLSYFRVCHEDGCSEATWKFLGIEACGFWRSLF